MAKGGTSEARGIAAISALVGKQQKTRKGVPTKNTTFKKPKPKKETVKKEDKPKAEDRPTSSDKPKSSRQFTQLELNFKPPKPKSENPRQRPTSKRASGSNPTYSRDADTGKLEKMSPEVQKDVSAKLKAFDEKKASYSPPTLKSVNLEG